MAMVTRNLRCRYCGTEWSIRAKTQEEVNAYLNCCKACWDDDRPGQARFDRMAALMGSSWALDHYDPR